VHAALVVFPRPHFQGELLHLCAMEAFAGTGMPGQADASLQTDAMDARGTSKWDLGECKDGHVTWREFDAEGPARAAFAKGSGTWSRVLFDANGFPASFSCVDSDGVDGALLLRAYAEGRSSAPDREAVARAVSLGEAPFVPPDRPWVKQWLMKLTMRMTFTRQTVRYFGSAPLRNSSVCYFEGDGVRGHVALTIDDAPCRFTDANSRVKEVAELLDKFGARATFMVVGSFIEAHKAALAELLRAKHELGNHCMLDRSYEGDSPEDFAEAVDGTSKALRELQRSAGVEEGVRWFRAPHGRYTAGMAAVLRERGLTNVMCDTYASCPVVQDGDFIGGFLARSVLEGGVILIHMPERGHREWCMLGLQRLLEGLQQRSLRAVTVSELHRRAQEGSAVLTSFAENGRAIACNGAAVLG